MKLSDLELNTDIFTSIIGPNVQAEFRDDKRFVKLMLSVSSSGTIEGICLRQEGFNSFVPYFTLIRLVLLKQDVSEVFKLNWKDLLDKIDDLESYPVFALPLYLMRDAVSKYLGKPPGFCSLKNIEPKDIVCHCFGVAYKDIESKTKEGGVNYEFKNLQEDLLISSGCGSCLYRSNNHFKKIQSQFYTSFKIINGHGTIYWARKIINDLSAKNIESEMTKNEAGEVKVITSEKGHELLKRHYSEEVLTSLI